MPAARYEGVVSLRETEPFDRVRLTCQRCAGPWDVRYVVKVYAGKRPKPYLELGVCTDCARALKVLDPVAASGD